MSMGTFSNDDHQFSQRRMQVTPAACMQNALSYESINSDGQSSNNEMIVDNQKCIQEPEPILINDFGSESFEKKLNMKLKKCKLKLNNVNGYEKGFPNGNVTEDCLRHREEPVKEERKGIIGNIQEDSSWYDLTDTSLTSIILNPLGSGDAAGRAKLHVFRDDSKRFEAQIESSKNLN